MSNENKPDVLTLSPEAYQKAKREMLANERRNTELRSGELNLKRIEARFNQTKKGSSK